MENQEKNVFVKIINGLCESTKEAHEVQKLLTNEQKQAFITRHQEATAPDLGLLKVKEAKGVKAKVAQIVENLKDGCKATSQKEKQKRLEQEEKMALVDPYIRAKKQIRILKEEK